MPERGFEADLTHFWECFETARNYVAEALVRSRLRKCHSSRVSCAIVTIGTELIRGELQNENAEWLASQISDSGLLVSELCTVADDETRIVAALQRLSQSNDVVVCTGGLGPTTDDRTSHSAARLLDVPLERDEASLRTIVEHLRQRGREPSPSNERQADFPRGAAIIQNSLGTAPGFTMQHHGCRLFFLPGVPSEMQRMFHDAVAPSLPEAKPRVRVGRVRTFGMPESDVNDRLAGLEEQFGATFGYRASYAEIEIKWLLPERPGEPEGALENRARELLRQVCDRLGEAVYAEGKSSLAIALGDLLAERELTFGLAESCTGGLVSQLVTQVPGSSRYYKGGICCYANSVKEGVLGVLPATLELHGAVSLEVAREMAIGAQRVLGSDISLAITGLAGPGGATTDKPVGLVHWAVTFNGQLSTEHAVFSGDRWQVQKKAALAGLWSVRQMVTQASAGLP